jgi:hypothetical protein
MCCASKKKKEVKSLPLAGANHISFHGTKGVGYFNEGKVIHPVAKTENSHEPQLDKKNFTGRHN